MVAPRRRCGQPMGYGVIGSPTGSGPVSLGSSPGTPASVVHSQPAGNGGRPVAGVRFRMTSRPECLGSLRRRSAGAVSDPPAPGGPGPAPAPAALQAGDPEDQQDHDGTDDRADDARRGEVVDL